MSQKRKFTHPCKNHPQTQSIAVCSACGSALCSNCHIHYKGKYYCTSSCIPQALVAGFSSQKQGNQKKQVHTKILISWSAGTLVLCTIVFAAWVLRELDSVKRENEALQNSRTILLSRLKSNSPDNDVHQYTSNDLEREAFLSAFERKSPSGKNRPSSAKVTYPPLEPFINPAYSFDNGTIDKKLVSLTFDGGSSANAALEILDTLRSRNVHATMFLTGQFIKKYPQITSLLFTESHEVGNHTSTHLHLTSFEQNRMHTTLPGVSHDLIHKELLNTAEILYSKTGYQFAPLWRSPYGEYNAEICSWARNDGYTHIGWRHGKSWAQSLDSHDWIPDLETPGYKSPDEVLTKILSLAQTKPYGINGGIILMHLGSDRKDRDEQVHLKLGMLIDSLRSLGYIFVPVSEMMKETQQNESVAQIQTDTVVAIQSKHKSEE